MDNREQFSDCFPLRLRRCIWLDFRRSFFSRHFLTTVGAFLIWMFLNCAEDLSERLHAYSLADYISIACVGVDNFSLLIFAIATFPYAWSYCTDKQHGFLLQARFRVGIGAYSISKAICVAITAFLAVEFALGIFSLILLSMDIPIVSQISAGVGPYTPLAVDGYFMLFYFVQAGLTGLTCALAAEFGLMITAFFQNGYYALVMPMFTYYGIDILQTFTSQILNADYGAFWINSIFFGRPFRSNTASYLWAGGWMMLLLFFCAWIFCYRVCKEFCT